MANYVVDPTDPTQPTNSRGAKQGAEELRALKGLVQTLIGGGPATPINLFRKNAIIGGNFDINPWQRGVQFIGIANNSYTADRWKHFHTGTMIEDITRAGDAPLLNAALKNKTVSDPGINCFQSNVTTAQAVLGAADFSREIQYIEGYNFLSFYQIPTVLSFWHKHTKPGIYCVALRNSVADRSYIAEYTQVAGETWEFEQILIPAQPAGGTWSFINGIGLEISFCKGCGITPQTPAGVWINGNFLSSANQVNSLDTIGNKFRIAFVQFERGLGASSFERRSLQEELLFCQRYYWKTFNQGTTPAQATGLTTGTFQYAVVVAAANRNGVYVQHPVIMRAAPAIITYNTNNANALWRNLSLVADSGAAVVNNAGDHGFLLTNAQVAGDAVGNLCAIHLTADAEL